MRGVPRAGGGSDERRAVGTPARGCADAACPPDPATDGVGAARSRALAERAVRVARSVLSRPDTAPQAQKHLNFPSNKILNYSNKNYLSFK